MNIEKLQKNLESRGFTFKFFETGAEAADYLLGELKGTTVGIGGSQTVDGIGLYDRLAEVSEVAWHWKQPPAEARERAAAAEAYITGANGIAETGEIVNIDGNGNRVASMLYGHKRLYVVAGVNKVEPDLDRAIWRARNIAAPKNARRFNADTPCVKGELKCYDCRSAARICRGMAILLEPMMGQKCEIVMINEELGY